MVSIVWSYPGFHALPRGVKQLLLISENLFFEQANPKDRSAKRIASPALDGPLIRQRGKTITAVRGANWSPSLRGISVA